MVAQIKGIALDLRLVQKNPESKASTKILLNSLWRTFGENLLKPTTEAFYNASHLFALVSYPCNDLRQVRIANDDSLEVVYADLEDNQPDNGRANMFVIAFTTCHARLKLYESLEQLQQECHTSTQTPSFAPTNPDN